ncbi:mini-circle protein [Streptomyces solincola]|uniref:Mini-circle protein n=1 Tax=Streptomyces solincola TaxID=2100817 RepID=A0A2S9PXJ7_9ACTN|nr:MULTISPECIES: DinB family protein [Streptomyces]PRH79129.1 mini-circle protein [Streptomyces solincola]
MTSISRDRPPFEADERTQLTGWYQLQRSIVHFKCEGLSEADARRAVLPDSPSMTVAGIVSHLRWVEHCWFEVLFLGGDPSVNPSFDEEVEDADLMPAEGVPLEQLLAEYAEQCARSDEIIAAHALETTGRHPDFTSARASLRWMVLHMVEETARHAGHLDTIRELLDGEKGYY